jgi:hypothetical protein
MITALTNMLLRRTVRRWFENDANVADTRRKLARFIGLTDRMPRGWAARAAGTAGGAALHRVAPKAGLPEDAPLIVYFHGGGYIVGGLASHAPFCARLARPCCSSITGWRRSTRFRRRSRMGWRRGARRYGWRAGRFLSPAIRPGAGWR